MAVYNQVIEGSGNFEVKVSSSDTTADFLVNKLIAGSGVTITKNNPGGNETLTISAGGGSVTIYNDTVSGTINGSNTAFTVSHMITSSIALVLANSSYQAGVDYTVSGTTITMTVAPDASLAGQPFWFAHT